ncbi:Transcriptional regulator GlxA family, contains an amidase domain and an AraC-type DNA-binding HTH domain [Lentzea fradiae]|uniref:Transcriptional regulator GlxA family, contains an amidase domain and an AraC-type DNA-binding HTH domain n=1 Tax=Lentzea fradiae TaxID=200378 RepID=A0A1G7L0R5_9PSEU|nr:helix-turn-helix domain-containing protein [Lentzea fradiae]SDF43097.1 Transcriptional regulator GlxA family, contains an amidase domain and an AraC-type DNA-binding HTH domain [Lentzea fradiae]
MPADPHVVAVLAVDGVVGFDLAIPCQVFGLARLPGGDYPYQVRVCGTAPSVPATAGGVGYYRIEAPHGLDAAEDAGTIVVPGMPVTRPVPPEVVSLLRAAARGVRTISICTGAFALAEAGLLAGRRATTHWAAAAELARRHPDVEVDAGALHVDEGKVLTSAGVAAGLDLCLHVVRRDFGAAVAAAVARAVVMPPTRDGDQAQFIPPPPAPTGGGSLATTLVWMRERASEPLSLADIARHANLSVRTLTRRFREQTGTTPLEWLSRQRLQLARELLETTDLPVPVVAERSGHGSATALRARFGRELHVSPNRYRRSFRQSEP